MKKGIELFSLSSQVQSSGFMKDQTNFDICPLQSAYRARMGSFMKTLWRTEPGELYSWGILPEFFGAQNYEIFLSGTKNGDGDQIFLNLSQLTALRRRRPSQKSYRRDFKWPYGASMTSLKWNTDEGSPVENSLWKVHKAFHKR